MGIKKVTFLALAIISSQSVSWASNESPIFLGEYANKLSNIYPVEYVKYIQTTKEPLVAYRIDFNTSEKSLLSIPNAASDEKLKLQNLAITKVWEKAFCKPELIIEMRKNNIDVVSGFLINNGKDQRGAVCFKSMNIDEGAQGKPDSVIGEWYDDVGSPDYMDSTLIISKKGQDYFLTRINGDASKGVYELNKKGNKYNKVNDKFGAYYVLDDNGLSIYDKDGYIRTAGKK